MSPLLNTPLVACAICALAYLIAIRVFPTVNLLDFPERYGLTRPRLPYPTGIVPVVIFMFFFLHLAEVSTQSLGLLMGIIMIALVSFIDDRHTLSWKTRLLIQIFAALLIFATGTRIYTITNPLEGFLGMGSLIPLDSWDIPYQFSIFNFQFSNPLGPLPVWSGIFTLLWLGLTMNALNWFDGIPGQVSTLSTIGFLVIGFLSLSSRVSQPELALVSFTLAGISFACLLFDFPLTPRSPFGLMGDTGAIFFGLMLGVMTIYSGGKVATAFLVLGVPLIDSFFVVFKRIANGRSPFKGSQRGEHLHHLLLEKNFSNKQVIFLTALLGVIFGLTALFLSTYEKFIAALVLFVIMGGLSFYAQKR